MMSDAHARMAASRARKASRSVEAAGSFAAPGAGDAFASEPGCAGNATDSLPAFSRPKRARIASILLIEEREEDMVVAVVSSPGDLSATDAAAAAAATPPFFSYSFSWDLMWSRNTLLMSANRCSIGSSGNFC